MGWISVKDRLPDERVFGVRVIVGRTEEAGCPSAMGANFINGRFMVESALTGDCSEFILPTHWMLMPDPPIA